MLIYMFATRENTGERFEIMTIEMYQGDVLYMELLDSGGYIEQIEQPEGYKYEMITQRGEDDDN